MDKTDKIKHAYREYINLIDGLVIPETVVEYLDQKNKIFRARNELKKILKGSEEANLNNGLTKHVLREILMQTYNSDFSKEVLQEWIKNKINKL